MAAARESPESAVARALSLLTAFTFTDPVLGVSELGRRVHLPKSTVHRLLSILVAEVVMDLLRHPGRSLPSKVEIRPSRPKKG